MAKVTRNQRDPNKPCFGGTGVLIPFGPRATASSEKHSPPWTELDEEQEEFERNRKLDFSKIKELGSRFIPPRDASKVQPVTRPPEFAQDAQEQWGAPQDNHGEDEENKA